MVDGHVEHWLKRTGPDGRSVMLVRIPDGYGIEFRNCQGEETRIGLSREAMDALIMLFLEINDADAAISENNRLLLGRS